MILKSNLVMNVKCISTQNLPRPGKFIYIDNRGTKKKTINIYMYIVDPNLMTYFAS